MNLKLELELEFERDTDGKPLSDKIPRAVNKIWKKPRDSEGYKNAAKRAKKPENVATHAVQVNEEIYTVMSPTVKAHDARLKSIQTMLCKAVVPAARLLDEVVSKSEMDKTYKNQAERHLIDTISLIAHANNTVNFQHREAIKKKLPPNYGMALKQPEEASATLFGDDCAEKLKKAGYGGRMQREMKQYQQCTHGQEYYPKPRRGRGSDRGWGYRPRPYPARRGRGNPFLGEENYSVKACALYLFIYLKKKTTTCWLCYRVPSGLFQNPGPR